MTRTATLALLMIAAFVAILIAVSASVLNLNANGLRGVAAGAALGLVNLAVGSFITRRSLRQGMKSAVGTLVGGFFVRLVVLIVLFVAFERSTTVNPAAFALTFMIFFFVYLGVELFMVERSTNGGAA
jgi:RsiW-degrading membrane proteinase PrsW (M82 family)